MSGQRSDQDKQLGIPIGIHSMKKPKGHYSLGGGSYNESTGLHNTNVSIAKSEPSGINNPPTLGPFMRAKIGSQMVKIQQHGGDPGSTKNTSNHMYLDHGNLLSVPEFMSPRKQADMSQNFSDIMEQPDTSNWQSFVKDFPELK